MKIKRYLPRLEQMVSGDLADLEAKSIFRDGDCYHVFGVYDITPTAVGFVVTKSGQIIQEFGTVKSALAWCSADKLRKNELSRDILSIERERQLVSADFAVRNYLAQHIKNTDKRDAVRVKLEHRRQRMKALENRLFKCCDLAKYWQIRGFNNETARTGRTASHRTNR